MDAPDCLLPADATPERPERGRRWPAARRRWQLVGNMERYLAIGPRVWKFTSWASARTRPRDREGLPPALQRVITYMAESFELEAPLETEIDEATAREAWERIGAIASRLAREEPALAHLAAPDELDAWQTVELCAVALAEGMRYPGRLAGGEEEPWEPLSPPRGRVARIVGLLVGRERLRAALRRVEPIELLLTSAVHAVRLDFRSLEWLVRQPLERGLVGLCRHYSRLVRALFHAAQRSTGRYRDVHVIEIGGYASFHHPLGHSWNWFVDQRSDRIVAFDLTGADWLLDRGNAATILNRGFDGTRWNNASAFLGRLMNLHESLRTPPDIQADAEQLFAELVEPGHERGQALLLNLACQVSVHPGVRRRIAAFLEDQGFNRWFVGWRVLVRAAEESLIGRVGQLGADPIRQHLLLDRIGLPRL